MRPPNHRGTAAIVAVLALAGFPLSGARPFPRREPDEHSPDEDCRGLCGSQACVDKAIAEANMSLGKEEP